MKIVPIFDDKLFSFHYKDAFVNELEKLLENWNDNVFLSDFYENNQQYILCNTYLNIKSKTAFIKAVKQNAQRIDELLEDLCATHQLNDFFVELDLKQKIYKMLPKNKAYSDLLRLYAIKIAENCFVITGGAIKITRFMDEHELTKLEVSKLEKCRNYLISNNVIDEDSFFEFLMEE